MNPVAETARPVLEFRLSPFRVVLFRAGWFNVVLIACGVVISLALRGPGLSEAGHRAVTFALLAAIAFLLAYYCTAIVCLIVREGTLTIGHPLVEKSWVMTSLSEVSVVPLAGLSSVILTITQIDGRKHYGWLPMIVGAVPMYPTPKLFAVAIEDSFSKVGVGIRRK
jgi:hypothetical protein